jgi:hypothetical protein
MRYSYLRARDDNDFDVDVDGELQVIDEYIEGVSTYDKEREHYIAELEERNEALEAENRKFFAETCRLAAQLADYVDTVDRMKLELIISGALRRPCA